MVSIVMVCHNRWRLTEQALNSLRKNTPVGNYTLTLVDDASTDFRAERLLKMAAIVSNTTLIRIEKSAGVVARAKNIGVEWSRQTFGHSDQGSFDWLYISDNDVYFKEDWLQKLTEYAEYTEPKGYRLWGGQIHLFHDQVEGPSVLDGPSWLMRWNIWDKYGPLDRNTAPGTCQSEEYPFCKELLDDDYKIGVVNPHVVIHTGLTNTKGEKTPGYEERKALMEPGVWYE